MSLPRALRAWRGSSLALPLVLAIAAVSLSCININIYFPEAEAREAAEEIVDEVRPDVVLSPDPGENINASPSSLPPPPPAELKSGALWTLFRPGVALAEEKAEGDDDKKIKLDVTSPVIKKIKETLKARYSKLVPLYNKGALGEGRDGYLALREVESLPLKEKRDVQSLLKAENDDRKNLYEEILKANGIELEMVAKLGRIFSEEWQKKSRTGWWIEIADGKWEKKKDEKAKKKGKSAAGKDKDDE